MQKAETQSFLNLDFLLSALIFQALFDNELPVAHFITVAIDFHGIGA